MRAAAKAILETLVTDIIMESLLVKVLMVVGEE